MTKTAAVQRDANRIKTLANEILGDSDWKAGGLSVISFSDAAKLEKIAELSGGLDASTGRRDSSTKSRRSRAAKKGKSAGAGRKRVTR